MAAIYLDGVPQKSKTNWFTVVWLLQKFRLVWGTTRFPGRPGVVPPNLSLVGSSYMVCPAWELIWGSSPDRARTTCSPAMRAWRRLICRLGLAFQARRRASFKSRLVARGSAAPPGKTEAPHSMSTSPSPRHKVLAVIAPLPLLRIAFPGSDRRR